MAPSDVVRTAHALSRHGLVTAFGHVSVRGRERIRMTPPGDLAAVGVEDLIEIPLDAQELPAGAPPEAWAHLAIYAARPDAAAVVRGMPPSAFAAGACVDAVPILHGQGAWLGENIPVHDDAHLLRSRERADAAARTLDRQNAVILRGNGALAIGVSPAVALVRLWLVEAASRIWLEAAAAGDPRRLHAEELAGWQDAAAPLLARLGEHLLGNADGVGA